MLPLSEIVKVTQAHTANPGSQTARNLLAKEAVTLIHGIEKASEAEFETNLLFPVDREKSHSAAEIISVWGDRVIKIPKREVVGEMIAKLARRVGAVKTRGAAEKIIKGGRMYHGLKNEKISDGMATVQEGWLVNVEVLLLRVYGYSCWVGRTRCQLGKAD